MLISLVGTFLSLAPTFYVAVISNSATLYADLLRCIVEFLAILVAYLVARITRPENISRYNYGFGKLEHLSSLVVAGAMLVAFIIALFLAVKSLIAPEKLENVHLGFLLALLSVAGNVYIWLQNARIAQRSPSPIAIAQSRLFRSKSFASSAVVLTLACGIYLSETYIGRYADAFGAFAVAGFLFYSSNELIFRSLGEIIDASLEESAQLLILKALVKFESHYSGIRKIRTRRGGGKDYIELWLEFDGAKQLLEVQSSIEEIKKEIKQYILAAEVLVVAIASPQ